MAEEPVQHLAIFPYDFLLELRFCYSGCVHRIPWIFLEISSGLSEEIEQSWMFLGVLGLGIWARANHIVRQPSLF